MIDQALNDSSFIAVLDFCDFSGRLENSMQSLACTTSTIRLRLMEASFGDFVSYLETVSVDLAIESFLDKIRDNRDFSIMTTIDPSGTVQSLMLSLGRFEVNCAEMDMANVLDGGCAVSPLVFATC